MECNQEECSTFVKMSDVRFLEYFYIRRKLYGFALNISVPYLYQCMYLRSVRYNSSKNAMFLTLGLCHVLFIITSPALTLSCATDEILENISLKVVFGAGEIIVVF